MALKRHRRVFLEVKGRSLMYLSGDGAKDKCASVRKGNVFQGCVHRTESQPKGTLPPQPPPPPPTPFNSENRAIHDYRLHFFGWRDCEMSEGTNGRFLTHIQ